MSGLFSSTFPQDSTLVEGVVTYVDILRSICTVQTIKGQYLLDVKWLMPTGGNTSSSLHCAPNLNDRVLVSTGLTYPVILGTIATISSEASGISATGGEYSIDIGTASSLRNGYYANPSRPSDISQGDISLTSSGGGILSLLSSGGIVAKASALSQIILTKFGNLVRIVSRNFQRISESSSECSLSIRGRVYHWFGQDIDLDRNRTGTTRYNEVIGDVALGENLKYNGLTINSGTTLPAVDNRLKKEWLINETGTELMSNTLFNDGKLVVKVGNSIVTIQQDKIILNNGNSTVTVQDADITSINGQASFKVSNDIITGILGNSKLELTEDRASLKFDPHFLNIDSSGIHTG